MQLLQNPAFRPGSFGYYGHYVSSMRATLANNRVVSRTKVLSLEEGHLPPLQPIEIHAKRGIYKWTAQNCRFIG